MRPGKPIYLELSSVNPVVILPGALAERGAKLAEEFTGSCLMASGPVLHQSGPDHFVCRRRGGTIHRRRESKNGSAPRRRRCFPPASQRNLADSVKTLRAAGAELVTGGSPLAGNRFANTLLRVSGETFLAAPEKLQTEAFGNASLVVVVRDAAQAAKSSRPSRRQSDRLHLFGHARFRTTRFTSNSRRCCGRASDVCSTTKCRRAWRSLRR